MPLLIRDDLFLQHDTGPHPECAERLRAVYRLLDAEGVVADWDVRKPEPVVPEILERVHPAAYIESVRNFSEGGGGRMESDTVLSAQSFDVALHAAGAAAQAVDAVLTGEHKTAVSLSRPPGHHALANKAMGFCLFANVSVAAQRAIDQYELSRVLIVDWDVHHGNGTQDLFYESPAVCFFSAHRWPFYPGTGAAEETGTGDGLGTTFNLPLEFGLSRAEYRERFHTMLAVAAAKCRPELLLLSAGFDAHAADPIGSLGLESRRLHRVDGTRAGSRQTALCRANRQPAGRRLQRRCFGGVRRVSFARAGFVRKQSNERAL